MTTGPYLKIHSYIGGKKAIIISSYFFAAQILCAIFFSSIASKLYREEGINKGFIGFSGPLEEFFISVLFAPVLETYLFQFLPIEYIKKKFGKYNIGIGCSTILFAIAHTYNLIYFANALVAGFLFAYFYCIMKIYKSYPVFWLIILHSIYNLLVFSLKYLI